MIIDNFERLARSPARNDALHILNAGIEAVLTKPAMHERVGLDGDTLHIHEETFDLSQFNNIYVIGGGKAAADMASVLDDVLGDRITQGLVTDVSDANLQHVEVVQGTHPLPSQTNADACERMLDIADGAGENDLVLTLISGGGSAILAHPRCSLEEFIDVNEQVLESGATIHEFNAVRKHLSRIKGGQLSRRVNPATTVSVIISDVLDNDLSVIASGPTVNDPSTLADAHDVIEKYELDVPDALEETPKDDAVFANTTNILLLTNRTAVAAMEDKAEELGYEVEILGYEIDGEARDVGARLAAGTEEGVVKIGAGETTVTVTGDGKGGRNQEVALGAVEALGEGVVLSAGTDGIDNTDAAGAIVDEDTLRRAAEHGLDPEAFLQRNDAYHFFEPLHDLVMTGPTGTNVADVMLCLS